MKTDLRIWCMVALFAGLLNPDGSFADEVAPAPGDNATEKSAAPTSAQPQSLTELATIKLDLRRVLKAKEHFVELAAGEETEGLIFQFLDVTESEFEIPPVDSPQSMQMYAYLAFPDVAFAMDVALPGSVETIRSLMKDSDSIQEHADGLMVFDDVSSISQGQYVAFRYLENGVVANTASELRKLIQEVENENLTTAFSLVTRPKRLSRSALKSRIAAQRAVLLTHAQKRDDDTSPTFTTVMYKSVASAYDAIFNETEVIELSYNYSEHDHTTSIALKFDVAAGSDFDRYVKRLGQTKNRVLSYLHPENEAFVSFTLPLPDQLSKKSALSLVLQEVLQLPRGNNTAETAYARIASQISDRRQVDLLVQSIPESNGSVAVIAVIPLEAADSLNAAAVQLISATNSDQWQFNAVDIDGWPVHRTRAKSGGMFFVMTDHCIAFGSAQESSMAAVESIIRRDSGAGQDARRFGRTALAGKCSYRFLTKLQSIRLPTATEQRLADDGPESIRDGIEVSLDVAPQTLTLQATFEPDAMPYSTTTFGAMLLVFAELINNLE